MNLDRLLKLLKLANHNSNDAEANSAARAASKLLGDENYKWLESAKKNGGRPPSNKQDKPTINEWYNQATDEYNIKITKASILNNPKIAKLVVQLATEVNGAGTWNDIYRSTEPQWRSTPPPKGSPFEYGDNPFRDGGPFSPFEDSFWENSYRSARRQERERQEYKSKEEEKNAQDWTWSGERSGNKGYNKTYKQAIRDCIVCKITRLTNDVETPYICYECKRKI